MNEISQADRFSDNRTDDPYWNESAWFSFSIPERGIHGFIYYFFRPNMNLVVGGPAMWDDTGHSSWDCLYYDWQHFQAMPEDARKFDVTLPNTTSVRMIEPSGRYRLHYDKNDFKLDLEWTALSEPHDFTSMEEVASAAHGPRLHIEQCGQVKGKIVHKGETLEVDCFALRDTSFGRRHFGQVAQGSYFWGMASPQTAFHVLTLGGDAEQEVKGGFMIKDGRMTTLVGGIRRVTEDGPFTPAAFTLDLEDEEGRTMSIAARTRSDFIFHGYVDNPTVWSLLEWQHEGQKVWGDIQEFMPLEMFRVRARRAITG